jgi:hypothetical protein
VSHKVMIDGVSYVNDSLLNRAESGRALAQSELASLRARLAEAERERADCVPVRAVAEALGVLEDIDAGREIVEAAASIKGDWNRFLDETITLRARLAEVEGERGRAYESASVWSSRANVYQEAARCAELGAKKAEFDLAQAREELAARTDERDIARRLLAVTKEHAERELDIATGYHRELQKARDELAALREAVVNVRHTVGRMLGRDGEATRDYDRGYHAASIGWGKALEGALSKLSAQPAKGDEWRPSVGETVRVIASGQRHGDVFRVIELNNLGNLVRLDLGTGSVSWWRLDEIERVSAQPAPNPPAAPSAEPRRTSCSYPGCSCHSAHRADSGGEGDLSQLEDDLRGMFDRGSRPTGHCFCGCTRCEPERFAAYARLHTAIVARAKRQEHG